MDVIVTGIVAGVVGTFMMDSLNHLFARTGILLRIDVGMIGRMAAGWTQRNFRYSHPDEIEPVANEKLYGCITHYTIGVGLAVLFVLGWDLLVGGNVPPIWALAYGVATTVNSVFVVYPALGLGVFGRRSPDGIKAPLSSLTNHFFFGGGMAVVVALA